MIWKSKEYMPGNGDNTCFTPGNVKYRYAMRTSSDLYREVLDDLKDLRVIFGGHYGVCQGPANAHCTGEFSGACPYISEPQMVAHLKGDSIFRLCYINEDKKK